MNFSSGAGWLDFSPWKAGLPAPSATTARAAPPAPLVRPSPVFGLLLWAGGRTASHLLSSERLQGQIENLILPLVRLGIQRKKQHLVNGLADRHAFGQDKDARHRLPLVDTLAGGRRDSGNIMRE